MKLCYILLFYLLTAVLRIDNISTASELKENSGYKNCPVPELSYVKTIFKDPKAHLRDPSSPIYYKGFWHLWATRVPIKLGVEGYPGKIYHYYSKSLQGQWNTSGVAVDSATEPGKFDSYGVFTPSAFRTKEGLWIMYYGGVVNGSRLHTESVGLATATNPFGPWTKSKWNPVFKFNQFKWCKGKHARVDEAEPYIVQGSPVILIKTCCGNNTALPLLFESKVNKSSFLPPYVERGKGIPIVSADTTKNERGFEQARIFPGPNRCLHLFGKSHAEDSQPHYISRDGSLTNWQSVDNLKNFGAQPLEPTVVWPKGSIPGDDYDNGVPSYFIQFTGNPLYLVLLKATWKAPANISSNQPYDSIVMQ